MSQVEIELRGEIVFIHNPNGRKEEFDENVPTLSIMQGLPGSGKSTAVKNFLTVFPDAVVCSADSFFMKDGEYKFDAKMLYRAHKTCFEKARQAVEDKVTHVVIDNTNLTKSEYEKYFKIGKENGYCVAIIRLHKFLTPEELDVLAERNVHGVPRDVIQNMYNRYSGYLGLEREEEF